MGASSPRTVVRRASEARREGTAARACKTPEDVLALAKEEGYELSDEELRSVSGGGAWSDFLECKAHCRTELCWELYHPAV